MIELIKERSAEEIGHKTSIVFVFSPQVCVQNAPPNISGTHTLVSLEVCTSRVIQVDGAIYMQKKASLVLLGCVLCNTQMRNKYSKHYHTEF